MYKSVYDLSPDQLEELKSAYFWSDETPKPKLNNVELPALFPWDIPESVIIAYYAGVNFVDDDFSSPPGDPWTLDILWFYEIRSADGLTYTRQWLTRREAMEHEKRGYIATNLHWR